MRIVSTAYHQVTTFNDPDHWLGRIDFYTGILEALALTAEVHSLEHINASGMRTRGGVHYHFRRFSPLTQRVPLSDHRLIRSLAPDAVLVNGLSVPLQVLQLRATVGRQAKLLLWHRDERPGQGWRGRLQARAARVADACLFTAPGNAAPWIEAGIVPEQKVRYLLHGSSVFLPGCRATARARLGLPEGPLFLWVARLDANKDPLCVLTAFAALLRSVPHARLAMAFGSGNLEGAVRRIVAADPLLAASVQLLGTVPHRALEDWYRSANFFISASHYEGGGIAFCEALSCGCIPVYAAIPSLQHLAGTQGVSFPPGNDTALEAALRKALTVDQEAQRQAVLQRFDVHFSFAAIARGLMALLSPSTIAEPVCSS